MPQFGCTSSLTPCNFFCPFRLTSLAFRFGDKKIHVVVFLHVPFARVRFSEKQFDRKRRLKAEDNPNRTKFVSVTFNLYKSLNLQIQSLVSLIDFE